MLLISVSTFAQKSINNYKYIIVPKQFDFVSSPDKYQTSSLTKFLFKKYGFTAYLSDEVLPNDLAENRCLALTGAVVDKSGMLTTKSVVELKDCNNNVVFSSSIGKSKIKDYKKAYHEAIRKAFVSVKGLNYKHEPLQETKVAIAKPKVTLPKKQPYAKATKKDKKIVEPKRANITSSLKVLYAQPKINGYQLVNTKPSVVFKILQTDVKNVFIIKNKNGILYKKNTNWIAEYYQNGKKVVKEYQVKF